MTVIYYLKLYLLTVPVFFAIDLLWLGVIAKDLNNESQGTIPGQDFAFAYFGIWLGEKPINKKFRDRLLGEEE